MDDRSCVQRRQRGEDAEADRQRVGGAHRPALEALREDFPFEQLHRDEQLAAVFANLVDLADVRMVDAGRGARLPPEALARSLVAPHRRDRLERDRALEPLVARGIDHAHPALAQLVGERIMPDALGDQLAGRVVGDAVALVSHWRTIISPLGVCQGLKLSTVLDPTEA
jgi:hypothetical protein